MSGTLLNNRPNDIAGAMNIISSPEWGDESNKLHHLLPMDLEAQEKVVSRYQYSVDQTDAAVKAD